LGISQSIWGILQLGRQEKGLKENQFFSKTKPSFLGGDLQMTFRNHKFYFDADEASFLIMKSLSGKSYFSQKDYQQLVYTLITKAYQNSNGKPIR
jgi:hypothetical protein